MKKIVSPHTLSKGFQHMASLKATTTFSIKFEINLDSYPDEILVMEKLIRYFRKFYPNIDKNCLGIGAKQFKFKA